MPAERGPSGTGHEDGFERESIPEWVAGMACQSSYPHEAHGSCPGLRRPSDPPVAVPGPASVPADPVVSPADTPEELILRARIAAEAFPGSKVSRTLAELADLAAALLAVGERDRPKVEAYDAARAEVKIDGHTRAYYVLRAQNVEDQGERDRQQIARLTEALAEKERHAGMIAAKCIRDLEFDLAEFYRGRAEAFREIRAVLAGEEDARP